MMQHGSCQYGPKIVKDIREKDNMSWDLLHDVILYLFVLVNHENFTHSINVV